MEIGNHQTILKKYEQALCSSLTPVIGRMKEKWFWTFDLATWFSLPDYRISTKVHEHQNLRHYLNESVDKWSQDVDVKYSVDVILINISKMYDKADQLTLEDNLFGYLFTSVAVKWVNVSNQVEEELYPLRTLLTD